MTGQRILGGGWRDVGLAAKGFSSLAGRSMGTKPPQVFLVLGRTRRLFWGWLFFAGGLMPGGKLPRRDTEMIILRVSHLAGSAYERSHHERLGKRVGLTREQIEATRLGADDPIWSERQRVLLASVDELHETRDLADASWMALRELLDERRAIEFLLLVGHYQMLATALNTLRVEPDQPR